MTSSAAVADRIFTLSEVSAHNTATDLWLIIHGKVYDVTSFRKEHPGGESVIVEYAGRGATEAFDGVGHSEDATSLLAKYLVGRVSPTDALSNNNNKKKGANGHDEDVIAKLPIKTLAEVGQNNNSSSSSDAPSWIIIRNLVYDVTKFWKMHPGGAKAIADLAGKDATLEFDRVGHTNNAMSLLGRYLIAKLPAEEARDWSQATAAQLPQYALSEVAKHCKEGDYWIVIDNRVYDVTNFIGSHPGGREPLTHNAGLDATDQFAEVGHSANAKNKLKGLQIGVLIESDRRTSKPTSCKSTAYTDVTAEALKKAAVHQEAGKFPFMTTFLILVLLLFSVGGIVLMIIADQSNKTSAGGDL